MLKKLRLKFVLINMIIVTVMLLGIFGVVLYTTYTNLEEDSIRAMQDFGIMFDYPQRPGDLPDGMRRPTFFVRIAADGGLHAEGSDMYDLEDQTFVRDVTRQALKSGEETGVLYEYALRYVHLDMPQGEKVVFTDISNEWKVLQTLVNNCLLIGLAAFLAFWGISILLSKWAIHPVDKAWKQQRQFVADASHELKTPVTVMLTSAEILQDPESTQEVRERSSRNILASARQMKGLVESLLELARVDNGSLRKVKETVDLSQLYSDGILPFEALYFEKDMELVSRIEPGICISGSGMHLGQVLDILLDNALKYSAPGARVQVELRKSVGSCLLTVSGPGEPIDRADLKNIFKRFYRVDKVRSMDHSYGLGLAIADSIVREHRGRIWAESENGVNTFRVFLPV